MTAGNGAIVTIERFAISWNETMGVCEKRGKKMDKERHSTMVNLGTLKEDSIRLLDPSP